MQVNLRNAGNHFGGTIPGRCPASMELRRNALPLVAASAPQTYAHDGQGIIEARMASMRHTSSLVDAEVACFAIGTAGVETFKEAGIGEITAHGIGEESTRRTLVLLSNNWKAIQQAAVEQLAAPAGIRSFLGMDSGDPIGMYLEHYNGLFTPGFSGAIGMTITSYENCPQPIIRNPMDIAQYQRTIKPGDDDFSGSLNPKSQDVRDLFRRLRLTVPAPSQLDPKKTIIDVTCLWLYDDGIAPIQRLHIASEIVNARPIK